MPKVKKRADGYYRKWYKGKQFLGRTLAEAEAKRDAYRYECEHGIEQMKRITLFDYVEQWLPAAKANVTKHTYNHYVHIIELLTDDYGNKLISAITPNDIKNVWKKMIGKSQSYLYKARYLYKEIFRTAIENGYCRTNPVETKAAAPHKGTKGSHRCLTDEEIHLIETVPHRMQCGAMFMLKAGLRRGEMLAISQDKIHDDRIFITEAVKFDGNRPVVGDPKTYSSVRSVPLFAPLKPFINDMGNYAFANIHGEHPSKKSFEQCWKSYMYNLSLKAGHEIRFRPHDLRHTFVTVCRDNGIDIRICMDWCGHASEKMILEIYDHPSRFREANAISIMDGNQNSRKTVTLKTVTA